MNYQVSADKRALRLNETDTVASVLQNIRIILSTFRGTVPLDRDLGISAEAVDRPVGAVRALLTAQLRETIEKYEPRATVRAVTFLQAEGRLLPTVEVEIHGE